MGDQDFDQYGDKSRNKTFIPHQGKDQNWGEKSKTGEVQEVHEDTIEGGTENIRGGAIKRN